VAAPIAIAAATIQKSTERLPFGALSNSPRSGGTLFIARLSSHGELSLYSVAARAVNRDDLAETCPIVLLALSTALAAVGRALIKWSVEALS
jgi:hypothetical protein